jgi:hypothetical protein
MTQLWELWLFWGVSTGLGTGMMAMAAVLLAFGAAGVLMLLGRDRPEELGLRAFGEAEAGPCEPGGLSLLFLPMSSFSLHRLSLFAVLCGLDWIATVPPTVKLASQAFGGERHYWSLAGSSPATNSAPPSRLSVAG